VIARTATATFPPPVPPVWERSAVLPFDDVPEWADEVAPGRDSDSWADEAETETVRAQIRARLRADLLSGLDVCRDALADSRQVRSTPLGRRLLVEVDVALAMVRSDDWDPTGLDNAMTWAVEVTGKFHRLAVACLVSVAAAAEWLLVADPTPRLRALAAYARSTWRVEARGPADGLSPVAGVTCARLLTVSEGGVFAALSPPAAALSG